MTITVRGTLALGLVAACMALGGCGYTALKAPCSPDDGVPPGYDTTPLAFAPEPRGAGTAPFGPALSGGASLSLSAADTCGPMKPI
jgi:hypothetical protein